MTDLRTGPLVLVACEFSAVVRDAFRRVGCDARSADLLETEGDPTHHYVVEPTGKGSLFPLIEQLRPELVIAHPPCTRLTKAGVRWLHERDLWVEMHESAVFFRRFLELDVPHIAVENPTMHRYAAEIIGRRHTQSIQPWMFGHLERKETRLWLKGLDPLIPTSDLEAETMALPAKERDRVHWAAPGRRTTEPRWMTRSRTLPGIAAAMAEQWGAVL